MHVVPQQYFIGKESLDANENHFYDFFRKIDNYSSLTEPNKKIEDYALLSNSNFGFYIQFEKNGHYTPNERTELNKIILPLFVSFLTSSWHENAFNDRFHKKVSSLKKIKSFFVWVYLPSENVIRYYNKNCFLKTNVEIDLKENQLDDIPLKNLVYFGFANSDFNLDHLSSCVETQSPVGQEDTICFVKLIPKSKFSKTELNELCKRYKTFELFKEIEAIQPLDNEEEKLMVVAQNFLVQTALKDSDTNTLFEKNLEPHLDVLDSSSLSGLRKMIFKRVLDEYKHNEKHETLSSHESIPQSAQKPEEPVIIRQDYNELIKQKFLAVFAQYTGLKQDFLGRLSKTLSKEQYDNLFGLCEQYETDLIGLQTALDKVNINKLTPENKVTFDSILAHAKSEMSFTDISNTKAHLQKLIEKNKIDTKTDNPSFWSKHKLKIMGSIVLSLLALSFFLYNFNGKKVVDPDPKIGKIEEVENVIINFNDEEFTYTGSVIYIDEHNFVPHLKGKALMANGTYEGEFLNGLKHGKGTFNWANGDKYEGDWKENYMYGKGTKTWTDGHKYYGDWINDNRNGYGSITYDNGDKYEGDWLKDVRHGHGTMTYTNGDKYEGDWKDNKRTKGSLTKPDGEKYIGDFLDGKYHGSGKLIYKNGDIYDGSFKLGKMEGEGKYTWTDGEYYIGNFKNGVFDGEGTHYLKNGKIYKSGTYENGILKK